MDNYIVINDKKTELTEEQLKALGIEVKKKRNNPFNSEPEPIPVYSIEATRVKRKGIVSNPPSLSTATRLIQSANSFNDKDFANQVYLHELLNRKLLKYAWDNECEDNKWNEDVNSVHYYIYFDTISKYFGVHENYSHKSASTVYFSAADVARKAIEDVIKPFMEEHKDFEW